jgi:hypothetical protein
MVTVVLRLADALCRLAHLQPIKESDPFAKLMTADTDRARWTADWLLRKLMDPLRVISRDHPAVAPVPDKASTAANELILYVRVLETDAKTMRETVKEVMVRPRRCFNQAEADLCGHILAGLCPFGSHSVQNASESASRLRGRGRGGGDLCGDIDRYVAMSVSCC